MTESNTCRYKALLLIGPTGSGKTPLGELLATKGFNGNPCHHFDFGQQLRDIASSNLTNDLISQEDLDHIKYLLGAGLLLENKSFHIAINILNTFCRTRKVTPDDYIVLNGMPRHIDQAKAIDSTIDVKQIIQLNCPPSTVFNRIESNTGNDRTFRIDDSQGEIENKLAIFNQRTLPLISYYQNKGIGVLCVEVEQLTSCIDMYECLQ